MELLFKTIGSVLIIFTTSYIGFSKAAALRKRHKKLLHIKSCIVNLKEQIRMHAGETEFLLEHCFDPFPPDYQSLNAEDVKMFKDFLALLGSSDTQTECERCELFISALNPCIENSEKQYRELNKLYKSTGVTIGIFICILLL